MIREIVIKNMALIDRLSVEFSPGLSVLTGETGAGKSILTGAIGLILGDRAHTEAIRAGAEMADISATFELHSLSPKLRRLCEENDVAIEAGDIIIRRTINRNGRNRSYVNQTPVPLTFVKSLGDHLLDLHGQHEHQSLLRPDTARVIIDSLPGVAAVRRQFDDHYRAWTDAKNQLAEHDRCARELARKRDFFEFQLSEIADSRFKPGEEAALEQEYALLSSAEDRIQAIAGIARAIEGDEQTDSLERRISSIRKNLEALHRFDAAAAPWINDIEAMQNLMSELQTFCAGYLDSKSAAADPARLDSINARLARIQRLKKKHGCSYDQLLALEQSLRGNLESIDTSEADRSILTKREKECADAASRAADALSKARTKAAAAFDARITERMGRLGFVEGQLRTMFDPAPQVGSHGAEELHFKVRANPGEPFLPLAKTASGGEISRLMLAIKTVMAELDTIPVLIFDEIDTGIGGMLAKEAAKALRELSATHQVLCISHLHQIASVADHHYRVTKSVEGNRTVTRVSRLTNEEKIAEISRMLGGDSEIARLHAEELLKGTDGKDL